MFKIYKDNPGSGADPDRAALKELLQDAKKGFFDVVAVWDSSRLARDVKLFLIIKDELKEAGARIEIMGRERDDSDSGRFMEIVGPQLTSWKERELKGDLLPAGTRFAEGKLIGCYPAYGLRHIRRDRGKKIDAKFEINEQDAGNSQKNI